MKLSIIMPIYNTKVYLSRCIDSVIKQSYKNIEIILVDDGSSDGSAQLCDEYAQLDKRVKVIHLENGGVSNARNVGIEFSTGDYITFIDSDDYIEKEMYTHLLSPNIVKYGPDLICSGYFYENEDGVIFQEGIVHNERISLLNNNNAYSKVFTGDIGANIWNKLFKRNTLLNMKNYFNRKYSVGEDLLFVCKFIEQSNKIIRVYDNYYHYVKRKDSVMNKSFDKKYLSILDVYEEIENDMLLKDKKIRSLIKVNKGWSICNIIYKLNEIGCNTKEYKKMLRKEFFYYFTGFGVSKNMRGICIMMSLNPKLTCILWSKYKKCEGFNLRL